VLLVTIIKKDKIMPNRFPQRLSAAGYALVPQPEVVRTSFSPLGPDWFRDASNLSFPSAHPEAGELVPRGSGDCCATCMLPIESHQSAAAQAGYSPLAGQIPGVHRSVDDGSAHNFADELYADPRHSEFHNSAGSASRA
jgi:hypothetical protein